MSRFTTYLKQLIDESGQSISAIARSTGIERTSIHKALKGERLLSYAAVQSLARYFCLSIDERRAFLRLYDIELQGEESYENRRLVCDLLNTLAAVNFNMPAIPTVEHITVPDVPIRGEYAVHSAVRSLLIYEATHLTSPTFRFFIPEGLDLTMELMGLWLNGHAFSVSELMSLPSPRVPYASRRAFLRLGSLIPLSLASRGAYRPSYFHGGTQDLAVSPLSHYIVTPDFLILLSEDLSVAYISGSPELIACYRDHFDQLLSDCEPLIRCSASLPEVLAEYLESTDSECYQILMSQPCPGRYITPPVIRKYLRREVPDYENTRRMVEQHFSVLAGVKKTYLTVFTEKGFADLIGTCVLQDLPPQFVPPLEPADIRTMLQALYDEIAAGTVQALITRPNQLRLPDYFSLYVSPDKGIHLYTTNAFVFGAYCCDLHITEPSVTGYFMDFLKELPGSPLVYSREETLQLLKQYLN